MADLRQRLYLIADEMRGMASLGRYFENNVYERERAHRIMALAAELAALADDRPVLDMRAEFEADPWMHMSPLVGCDAMVFNPHGGLLLIQRRDNRRWALPGGLCEVGSNTAETAVKELWEEAGLRGEATRLLGIFDGQRWNTHAKVHILHVVYEVRAGELTPAPGVECLDARFFPTDALPAPLHAGHELRIPAALAHRTGPAYFDAANGLTSDLSAFQRPGDDRSPGG